MQRDVANRLGVHEGTVTAWERGYRRPDGDNVIRLARLYGVEPEEIMGNRVRELRPTYGASTADPFGSESAVTRMVVELGPPGEAQLAKLDLLEGYRQMMTAAGRFPRWWYDLKEKVQRGDL